MIPLIGGPVEALAIAGVAIAALVAWLRRARGNRGPRLVDDGAGIDRDALEAAEREVREAPPLPPAQPRPPERL
ncbi:MAG: hypothetical protein ACREOF_15210 [Gemmatimonadales bacterium]